jgi:uncharacterized lipoprotein YajG
MNLKRAKFVFGYLSLWTTLLFLCAGCATKQLKVDMNYIPSERALLGDLKPAVVSLHVVDQRPIEQQGSIGVQRNTMFGTKHADIISKTSVAEEIYDALKAELERGGHKVLNSEQGRGDITLIIWLKQFIIDSKAERNDIELVGNIRAEALVFSNIKNIPQVSFIVEGSYRDFIPLGLLRAGGLFGLGGITFSATPKSHIENVLNGALAEFVRRFCQEPKFRKAFI